MKKIITTLLITSTLILTSVSASACVKCLDKQIKSLFPIFKHGAEKGFAILNKDGLDYKVKDPMNSYVVCYENDEKTKSTIRVASTKEVLPNGDVTSDKETVSIVDEFFKKADGKTIVGYEFKGRKKQALIVDVSSLDKKYPKGKAVCAAAELSK